MNAVHNPEATNTSDLQIYNNAAFDNGGDSQDFTTFKDSPNPEFAYLSSSFESDDSTKENRSPLVVESPPQIKPNGLIRNSKMKQIKPVCDQNQQLIVRDEKKIDAEIEETEKEIERLSSRLQILKLKKAEFKQRGNGMNTEKLKKIGEKNQKRGFSLGPSEIVAGDKSRQVGKALMTPVQSMYSTRRKSCFWKLEEIGEEKVFDKERGKSLSPKSRKGLLVTRNAATTIGSKKVLKKDDGVLESIQPKKLFRDGEKLVVAKKSVRPGRIVASRYNNQGTIQSALKKRSLPENEKDEGKRCDKKRASFVAKTQANAPAQCGENRTKKRWEIPNEIVVFRNLEGDESPSSVSAVQDLIPRIRTSRIVNDTPRDSGPAKRVSELVGKKSFFSNDVEEEASVCQALCFADEDAQEEV